MRGPVDSAWGGTLSMVRPTYDRVAAMAVIHVLLRCVRMRLFFLLVAICTTSCARPAVSPLSQRTSTADSTPVGRELQHRYEENRRALLAKDFGAIMALRTDDFHAVTPDSAVHDRAEMEQSTRALLEGIDRWISLTFDIDSLEVSGDLARAVVRQHADRMARRSDGKVRHVETWVTQHEIWRRTPDGWKLYRVDSIRDQRRLIDGRPG